MLSNIAIYLVILNHFMQKTSSALLSVLLSNWQESTPKVMITLVNRDQLPMHLRSIRCGNKKGLDTNIRYLFDKYVARSNGQESCGQTSEMLTIHFRPPRIEFRLFLDHLGGATGSVVRPIPALWSLWLSALAVR
jgi:hypothetical protein